MRAPIRNQIDWLTCGLALAASVTIATSLLLAGAQSARAQPVPGQACTVNGQPGVYVCPAGTFQNGFICQNLTPPPGELPAICQATGPSLAKQATLITKMSQPRTGLMTSLGGAMGGFPGIGEFPSLPTSGTQIVTDSSHTLEYELQSLGTTLTQAVKNWIYDETGNITREIDALMRKQAASGRRGLSRGDKFRLNYLKSQIQKFESSEIYVLNKKRESIENDLAKIEKELAGLRLPQGLTINEQRRFYRLYIGEDKFDKYDKLRKQLVDVTWQEARAVSAEIRRREKTVTVHNLSEYGKLMNLRSLYRTLQDRASTFEVILGFEELEWDPMSSWYNWWHPGSVTRLGMDVPPPRADLGLVKFDTFVVGDGAVANGSGVGIRDANGLMQPGALTPNSRSTSAGVGIRASLDATGWLNLSKGQTLTANGFVSYSHADSKSGNTAALAAVGLTNTGTSRADNVTAGGDVRYGFWGMYVQGAGAFSYGRINTANTVDGSEGSFDSRWYNIDLRAGKTFVLANGIFGRANYPELFSKGPRLSTGGYIVSLDLSGHVGHTNMQADGFTDSTGFISGTSETRYEAVGGRAELSATVMRDGVIWKPHAAMKVDQRFDYSSVAYFPVQPDLPTGNVVYYGGANTFWGPELGLTIAAPAWWSVQARGFYLKSADANVAGGSLQVRIPFNP